MTILQHIVDSISALPIEKIIGFFYMIGIIGYLSFLSIRHKNEFWEAVRGKDGKLEIPELIIAICMIIYPNLILADAFLGLHASDGVFWSIDAIILFALTGRIAINKFGGATEEKKNENKPKEDEQL
jgi:hypothetical protein